MINVDKLPPDVLSAISANMGAEADTAQTRKVISLMTPEEAFQRYCTWNGLLAWAPTLIKALDGIRAAVVPTLNPYERATLEWLGKEDRNALGECSGPSLDRLVELGLAVITEKERGDWANVTLTDAGRALLNHDKEVKG